MVTWDDKEVAYNFRGGLFRETLGGGGCWTSLTSGGSTMGRRPICESKEEEVLNVLVLANKMSGVSGLLRQSARRSVRASIMYLPIALAQLNFERSDLAIM